MHRNLMGGTNSLKRRCARGEWGQLIVSREQARNDQLAPRKKSKPEPSHCPSQTAPALASPRRRPYQYPLFTLWSRVHVNKSTLFHRIFAITTATTRKVMRSAARPTILPTAWPTPRMDAALGEGRSGGERTFPQSGLPRLRALTAGDLGAFSVAEPGPGRPTRPAQGSRQARVSAESGRLWHAQRPRRADLCRQGQEPAHPAAELFSSRPGRQGGPNRRTDPGCGLGAGAQRVRRPLARTRTDPPLAAALQRAGPAHLAPPGLSLRRPAAGALRLPLQPAARNHLRPVRADPRRRASPAGDAPAQRLVSAA